MQRVLNFNFRNEITLVTLEKHQVEEYLLENLVEKELNSIDELNEYKSSRYDLGDQ